MTERVVVIKVVIDGAGGPRDRTVLGWMDAIGGWHCERHPRGRTCECRQTLAAHLAAHPPAVTPMTEQNPHAEWLAAFHEWIAAHAALGHDHLAAIARDASDVADHIATHGDPARRDIEARALHAQAQLVAELAVHLLADEGIASITRELGEDDAT